MAVSRSALKPMIQAEKESPSSSLIVSIWEEEEGEEIREGEDSANTFYSPLF